MTGASKLLCLLLWSLAAMTTFDTRLLAVLSLFSLVLFALSKLRLSEVSFLLSFTLVFLLLNNLLIFLFSPQHGVSIYGSYTPLLTIIGKYVITSEQLFYHLNVVLKYTATIPIVLIFVCTTDPSEFASSLNRIGIPYKVSYSVSLALRYIPDIQRAYQDISISQQARGIEMSKKEKLGKRLKSAASILLPLILSTMEKIEVIANAMELRCFGKYKKRTWYNQRPFKIADYAGILISILLFLSAFFLNKHNGGRYFNPFM
jgi:energy-coupling factor transport system permease protein